MPKITRFRFFSKDADFMKKMKFQKKNSKNFKIFSKNIYCEKFEKSNLSHNLPKKVIKTKFKRLK